MAGYMTKLQSYVYEGEWVNGEQNAVQNGILMVQNGDQLELPSAESTSKFVCKEVTTIYGEVGYRFVVDKLNKRYYFVENGMDDYNDMAEYDGRLYETKSGELLRAHPLLVGDEFLTNAVTGAPVAGNAYGVQADGTIG